MNLKKLLILFSIIAVSCNTIKETISQKEKNRVEIFEYKNFKGERLEDYSGIAITRNFYTDNKLTSVKYFDINDEPVKNKKSWTKQNAEWRFEYDENGNFIRQTAHDLNGDLFDVEHWGNSAIEILEYNDKNQLIKKSNFDKSIKLVGLGDIGDALTEYKYNEKGQLIWKKSYDADENFINNGFCYSEYEYNQDGTLKRLTYLYSEDKLNKSFDYSYKDGHLVQEESFDEDGNKIGYELFEYDESGRMIETKNWHHKWEKPNLKKEEFLLDLKGWKINDSDLKSINFKESDKGEYEIKINQEGEILDIRPVKHKGGTLLFDNEIYAVFKDIKFVKEKEEAKLSGLLKVVKIHQEIGVIYDIERVLNPKPYY